MVLLALGVRVECEWSQARPHLPTEGPHMSPANEVPGIWAFLGQESGESKVWGSTGGFSLPGSGSRSALSP